MPFASKLAVLPDNPLVPTLSRPAPSGGNCRLCGARLHEDLIDLGCLPLAGHSVPADATLVEPARHLRIRVCGACTLVQTHDPMPSMPLPRSDLQRSAPRREHARRLAAALIQKWRLGPDSRVVQVGSGDGMLLRHFRTAGIAAVGIDARGVDAREIDAYPDATPDIPTETTVLTTETAMDIAVKLGRADVVIVDGVLPKVLDMFDFAAGLASIVRPNGIVSITVPYVLPILQQLQFDALRHDVHAYLSLRVLERLLCSVGLRVFDAERLPENGGLLWLHACVANARFPARHGLKAIRTAETLAETDPPGLYDGFSARVGAARDHIREFVTLRQAAGRYVAAYGATARSSMLLNVCGLTSRDVACVADIDPAPFGRRLPGSRVPIVPLQMLKGDPPDDLLILPWPDAHEIAGTLQAPRHRGMQLWTLLPRIARV
ncbi:MAG TPA: class I SAM-dependent methyltransferase [Rhodopila sp.]|nr:class I SAM-dependent methyltransferase [Rhodopila sp.]